MEYQEAPKDLFQHMLWLTTLEGMFRFLTQLIYVLRYDIHLLLGEIYRMKGLNPEIMRSGNKIYQMKLHKTGICPELIFKDSFNFISQSLESLPKTLDLKVTPKMFFPHEWNRPENMLLELEHLPAKEYYNPQTFKLKKKREEFEKFYAENSSKSFRLADALKEYCGI